METVRFFDIESGQVVTIPAAELAAGAIRARVDGIEGEVWLLADKLKDGGFQHPPFSEPIRDYIRKIQAVFAEHYPISFEEWEDGFRRDANPGQEIGIWNHAADVYTELVEVWESPAAERRAVYTVIGACMNATPDTVRRVIGPVALDPGQVDVVVARYYRSPG